MKISRVSVSCVGQLSRNTGAEKTCCTPCTTAGRPGISSIATIPFIRIRRSPQCSARACNHNVSASAGSVRTRRKDSVSIPSVCRARSNGEPIARSASNAQPLRAHHRIRAREQRSRLAHQALPTWRERVQTHRSGPAKPRRA